MSLSSESEEPLLSVRKVVQDFRGSGWWRGSKGVFRALHGVSFDVARGETLGIVGESGSGKTTLARALLQAPKPTSGSVHFLGRDLTRLSGRRLLEQRRPLQLIFQDPFGSLDPKWTVTEIVEEPLIGYGMGSRAARLRRVQEVLGLVGLPWPVYGRARPRALSGGQCQRIAIARALASSPALIVCDEAISALDSLIQAQLLNLFALLRAELGLALLFISHDLPAVRHVSDTVAVLYRGRICEIGPSDSVYRDPRHPYTSALLASVDSVRSGGWYRPAQSPALDGAEPVPSRAATGCAFRTMCSRARERCAVAEPQLSGSGGTHLVACHYPVAG